MSNRIDTGSRLHWAEAFGTRVTEIESRYPRRLPPLLGGNAPKAPPKQPKAATIQIRVEEDVKLRLEKYAEFIDSSPAYVVTEALKLLFKKDEEFKSWLGQHTNNHNLNQIEGGSLTEIAKKA